MSAVAQITAVIVAAFAAANTATTNAFNVNGSPLALHSNDILSQSVNKVGEFLEKNPDFDTDTIEFIDELLKDQKLSAKLDTKSTNAVDFIGEILEEDTVTKDVVAKEKIDFIGEVLKNPDMIEDFIHSELVHTEAAPVLETDFMKGLNNKYLNMPGCVFWCTSMQGKDRDYCEEACKSKVDGADELGILDDNALIEDYEEWESELINEDDFEEEEEEEEEQEEETEIEEEEDNFEEEKIEDKVEEEDKKEYEDEVIIPGEASDESYRKQDENGINMMSVAVPILLIGGFMASAFMFYSKNLKRKSSKNAEYFGVDYTNLNFSEERIASIKRSYV